MTKNNDGRLDHCDPIPDFIKSGIYRVFNFIFLFLFFCTGAVFASGSYASNTILSINAEKKSIAEVLNVIENKSEYHFFYKHHLLLYIPFSSLFYPLSIHNMALNDLLFGPLLYYNVQTIL